MKTRLRVFAILTALALLMTAAAAAQSGEKDLYAPFESDFGPISQRVITPGNVFDDEGQPLATRPVQVELSASWDFVHEIEDPETEIPGMFYLVSMDGFYYIDGFTTDEGPDGNASIILFFTLPADGELADYRLAYNGQMRMLAETESADADEAEPGETEQAAEDEPQETIEAVLGALGEPLYQTTYEDLAKGNVICKDNKSGNARGLQTLVAAFGYDVPVDSLADKRTFNPLHRLQAVFGMEVNNTVDAEDFSYLLTCLYIQNDPDGAQELLTGAGAVTDSEFYYLQGCCAEQEGLYYTAYAYFDQSGGEDASARAQACIQPWPASGELYHNKDYFSGEMQLDIKVDNQDEGYASYFKIYSGNGDLVCSLFARGSRTVTANLPGGMYSIKLGTGENWFGPDETFGHEGYYETLLFDGDDAEVFLKAGYVYTLTINTSISDPEADGVDSKYTDYGDF